LAFYWRGTYLIAPVFYQFSLDWSCQPVESIRFYSGELNGIYLKRCEREQFLLRYWIFWKIKEEIWGFNFIFFSFDKRVYILYWKSVPGRGKYIGYYISFAPEILTDSDYQQEIQNYLLQVSFIHQNRGFCKYTACRIAPMQNLLKQNLDYFDLEWFSRPLDWLSARRGSWCSEKQAASWGCDIADSLVLLVLWLNFSLRLDISWRRAFISWQDIWIFKLCRSSHSVLTTNLCTFCSLLSSSISNFWASSINMVIQILVLIFHGHLVHAWAD